MKHTARQISASLLGNLERRFDAVFTTQLALREKQIQQNYRPIIGIHKWFARRPGTVFRSLLLAEFGKDDGPAEEFWVGHSIGGIIADPFMGGGTPLFEANRLGFNVIGCDINPMSHWIVKQSLTPVDLEKFKRASVEIANDIETEIGHLYTTSCIHCNQGAQVKYFMWVKTAPCPDCDEVNDLFPGYRLAEAERHPRHVLACASCGHLNEFEEPPTKASPGTCTECQHEVHIEGNVQRQKVTCRRCSKVYSATRHDDGPPKHRLWAIEYYCENCYKEHDGRLFKAPDKKDLKKVKDAESELKLIIGKLPIPEEGIPAGDETDRLHRWGYRFYREMFTSRQLLGLGKLLDRIGRTEDTSIRNALLTVFSDILRYQNLLCRYDTYALKCQDIFSVHGFPVALVQCENSLLGVPRIGSGSFRHFVEKYIRAKEYCRVPFETKQVGKKKQVVPIQGESIEATIVSSIPFQRGGKQAFLLNGPSQLAPLGEVLLDGVFTDPPYFDNVQYAELMDFCYVWLRQLLKGEYSEFSKVSTRSSDELTGNDTLGRGLDHFTEGLSEVFTHFAGALKPDGPFVFTYHHNDPEAYLPLIVAILDAGLDCTASLPAAAEMSASLHISGTGSSILDSVFVCRKSSDQGKAQQRSDESTNLFVGEAIKKALLDDSDRMRQAGVKVTTGDLRCLLAGHLARYTIHSLRAEWKAKAKLESRLEIARKRVRHFVEMVHPDQLVSNLLT